jgi:transcription antitermination factor NusG
MNAIRLKNSCDTQMLCAMESLDTTDAAHNQGREQCNGLTPSAENTSIKFTHGGSRPGTGGARVGTGGPQPGSGRPRKDDRRIIESRPHGQRWYVIQIAPGETNRVVRELLEGDDRNHVNRPPYEVESPQIAEPRFIRGERVVVYANMFVGYAFVRFDARADRWEPIRALDGVTQLFMTRSLTPIPLPDGFVEKLIEDAPARLKLQAVKMPVFELGQALMIEDGPFTGFAANCVRCNGYTTEIDVHVFGALRLMRMQRGSLRAM